MVKTMSYGDIIGSLLKGMTNKGRSRFEHMPNFPQLASEYKRSIRSFLHSIGSGLGVMAYANKHISGARYRPVVRMAVLLHDRNLVADLLII